jgi:hypothetical protein
LPPCPRLESPPSTTPSAGRLPCGLAWTDGPALMRPGGALNGALLDALLLLAGREGIAKVKLYCGEGDGGDDWNGVTAGGKSRDGGGCWLDDSISKKWAAETAEDGDENEKIGAVGREPCQHPREARRSAAQSRRTSSIGD